MIVTGDAVNDDMPHADDDTKLNPLEDASILSQCFFLWAYPLLKKGAERPLDEPDLPELVSVESSEYNRKKIEKLWMKMNDERNYGEHSLGYALLWDYFFGSTFPAHFFCIINMGARIGQALALGLLIEQFDEINETNTGDLNNKKKDGYIWVSVLVICGLVLFLAKQQQFFRTYRKGVQLRIGCVAAIYAKSLRLPSIGGNHDATSGSVSNLASNDVERFILATVTGLYLLWGPIEALAILIIGLNVIGWAFAAGYAMLLFVFVPLQMYLSKRFAVLRLEVATYTDERASLISQAVSGARVMKMNGWEYEFHQRISQLRQQEIQKIELANRCKALNEAIYFFGSMVIGVVIFATHVIAADGTLTSRAVFTCLTLLNILQYTLTKHIPLAIAGISECYVSCKRIQAFLEIAELPKTAVTICAPNTGSSEKNTQNHDMLSLFNIQCHWKTVENASRLVKGKQTSDKNLLMGTDKTDISALSIPDALSSNAPIALDKITLTLKSGTLYCVVGKIGSGKSALLQAIIGELPLSAGDIFRNYSSLAYASQDPWIMDGTIRENITMGLDFREEWYNKVLTSCALDEDIKIFKQGDLTVVGDRGVQCSGGQRMRIGLARAMYKDTDILLLDDPLSAVDSKVANSIFYSAIQNLGTKRGKCVVLVTHQHQFIGDSTCILMDKGMIVCEGSYSDCLQSSNGSLTAILQTDERKAEPHSSEESIETINTRADTPSSTKEKRDLKTDSSQKEGRTVGIIKLNTWISYGKAMGGVCICIAFFVLFSVAQASLLMVVIQVGKWAEMPSEDQNSMFSLGIIFGLTAAMIFVGILRSQLSFHWLIKASQSLHDRMTESVLRAKIEFFDTNPLGRIINRFSADVGINDEFLPVTINDFLVGLFMAVGGVATAIVVLPFILVVIPPLVWYFLKLRSVFVSTTREVKRLEGIGRSPIFAMMSEALIGTATIRANGSVEYFRHKFEVIHDTHTKATFAFIASSRWFSTQLDLIAFLLMASASALAVLFHDQGWFDVNPPVLGLALTMLLQLAGTNFPWTIRQGAEVTNQMVSVERVLSFVDLEPEAALATDKDGDMKEWPSKGSISAENLAVRYRSNLPLALSGVTFNIEGGHKIGIVGRTGSGKSSLVQALFRLLEAEEGKICIDGADISKLGLHTVRGAMSVIPQSPVLFSGRTIRENLDPFSTCDDDSIYSALADVQMIRAIKDLQFGLDSIVTENGSNFSVGQRQLLCLARAILRKNRILVLDEPTANVDTHTDKLLHQALAKKFSGATIISVAHRLDTVIDYDRILVLGNGKVLEYGSPKELLTNEIGQFFSMVKSTGAKMEAYLHEKAQNCTKDLNIS